jgi:hypothetical protein
MKRSVEARRLARRPSNDFFDSTLRLTVNFPSIGYLQLNVQSLDRHESRAAVVFSESQAPLDRLDVKGNSSSNIGSE